MAPIFRINHDINAQTCHSRRPKPLRTCCIAERVASSVDFAARTSSHKIIDSSTFCRRTSARAFSAYWNDESKSCGERKDAWYGTLIKVFLGCFFNNLLHETTAVLGEPVSSESTKSMKIGGIESDKYRANHRSGVFDVQVRWLTFRLLEVEGSRCWGRRW